MGLALLQFFNDPALIPPAMLGGALNGMPMTKSHRFCNKGLKHKVVMPIDFYSSGGINCGRQSPLPQ
jgi:NitT/TauT family transport system substrate-binding protein